MRKDVTPREMLLDRRVVERNIRKGLVTREEYQQYVSSLPDAAENAEEIRARLGEEEALAAGASDEDDDEDDEDLDDDVEEEADDAS